MAFRVCERFNPMAMYGRGFMELTAEEQLRVLAFVDLRDDEEEYRAKQERA